MKLGIIGLGKMGENVARNFSKAYDIYGHDLNQVTFAERRFTLVDSLETLVNKVGKNGVFWLMLPDHAVDEVMLELATLLKSGGIVIDAGNSNPERSSYWQKKWDRLKIHFIGVGMSGGPEGASNAPPMMVGGSRGPLETISPLLKLLGGNVSFFDSAAKAHKAKAIHNAIEYGMMQSIAEGVSLYLKQGFSQKDMISIFKTWSSGSIIESKLIHILFDLLTRKDIFSPKRIKKSESLKVLKQVTDPVTPLPVIKESIRLRELQDEQDELTLTILALMRNHFGGHEMTEQS